MSKQSNAQNYHWFNQNLNWIFHFLLFQFSQMSTHVKDLISNYFLIKRKSKCVSFLSTPLPCPSKYWHNVFDRKRRAPPPLFKKAPEKLICFKTYYETLHNFPHDMAIKSRLNEWRQSLGENFSSIADYLCFQFGNVQP